MEIEIEKESLSDTSFPLSFFFFFFFFSGSVVRIFDAHAPDGVLSVDLRGGMLGTGTGGSSKEEKVCVWDWRDGKCLMTVRGAFQVFFVLFFFFFSFFLFFFFSFFSPSPPFSFPSLPLGCLVCSFN